MAEMNVVLNEADFRKLVAGGIVTGRSPMGHTVEIALADIGFNRMVMAITDAVEQRAAKNH